MKSQLSHRAERPPAAAPIHHAPNAALLIDFDNVTLGVRSDLAKELRTLLNSDIIRGKVAVQRAYADWRRYPQYIVSLSEASIDLIFAPAFGTAKKNATDIRLAVDAIELVFTRPEIGTFILLSGDSDFSSLVLKLKEYGKYVIGVGIRESASDILIQNCDEYYSYNDLAGLSKEAVEPGPPRDPWELVVDAVAQMARDRDVMRADRLKQVMQQIDPAFDEHRAGYSRFSKFVTEAGTRQLIRVTKLENGQLEVGSNAAAPAGRSRPTPPRPAAVSAAPAPGEGDGAPSGRRRRGGRGRGRGGAGGGTGVGGKSEAADASVASDAGVAATVAAPASKASTGLTLAEAFHLLSRALGELPVPVGHDALRARMAVLYGTEDPLLDPSRFSKLLRQANDAEVADVRLLGEDQFEISPHRTELSLQRHLRPPADPATAPERTSAARPALRFRGGSRSAALPSGLQMVGVIDLPAEVVATPSAQAEPVAVAAELDAVGASTDGVAAAEGPKREKSTRRGRRGGGRGGGGVGAKSSGKETPTRPAPADETSEQSTASKVTAPADGQPSPTKRRSRKSSRRPTSKPRDG